MDTNNSPSQSSAAEVPSTSPALVAMEAFDRGSTGYLLLHEDGSMLTRDEALHILALVTDYEGHLRLAPPPIMSV